MLNKTRYHFAGCALVVVTILISAGCSGSGSARAADEATKSISDKIVYTPLAKTTAELKQFFGDQSHNEHVNIQTREGLVFVQTFPYSGVWASDLFVYKKSDALFKFFCFFNVPTQDDVDLKAVKDGSVEIRAADRKAEKKLLASLPQPAGS